MSATLVHYIVFVLPYFVNRCAVSIALLFVRPYTVSKVGFCLLSCYVFNCAACNSVLCAVCTVQLCVYLLLLYYVFCLTQCTCVVYFVRCILCVLLVLISVRCIICLLTAVLYGLFNLMHMCDVCCMFFVSAVVHADVLAADHCALFCFVVSVRGWQTLTPRLLRSLA